MTEPKISVVLPIYNAMPHLRRCLDSLAEQTHQNLQILCVDDGSTDGSAAVCDEYAAKDGRFCVLHQENAGAYAARNAALDAMEGDYVAFADADDWLEPNTYERLLETLLRSGADAAQCEMQNEGSYAQLRGTQMGQETVYPQEQLCAAFFREEITHGLINKLFRAELWRCRRFEEGYYHVDAMEMSRLEQFCTALVRIDDRLYHYNTTSSGITRGKKTVLHLRSREKLFDCFDASAKDLEEGSFYICREIPSVGGIFLPQNGLRPGEIRRHVTYMHRIFRRHWPRTRKSPQYAEQPWKKKVLWHGFFLLPHLFYFLAGLRRRLYFQKGR